MLILCLLCLPTWLALKNCMGQQQHWHRGKGEILPTGHTYKPAPPLPSSPSSYKTRLDRPSHFSLFFLHFQLHHSSIILTHPKKLLLIFLSLTTILLSLQPLSLPPSSSSFIPLYNPTINALASSPSLLQHFNISPALSLFCKKTFLPCPNTHPTTTKHIPLPRLIVF